MIRRREVITLLGGAAAWPLAARAQQPLPMIGFLSAGSYAPDSNDMAAFRQGLGQAGYVEGRNVEIEYRWAENRIDRLPALAADLVRRRMAAIVASGNAAALAAKATTPMIPIVFSIGGDPVKLGLVPSFNRPGGNITGVTFFSDATEAKILETLHEAVPTATRIAALVNPANPNGETDTRELREAARSLGLQLDILNASTEREIDTAFAALIQRRAGGLVIHGDPLFINQLEQLVALTGLHSIPAIYNNREFAAAGGLMSYGGSIKESYHQAGMYAGRILKGERPADLPVQQVTKVELTINLKTARALGLTVPIRLLGRADEVIE